jgi:hypothetical protein
MAGEVKDVKALYRLVLGDFKSSGMIDSVNVFGLLDSTCTAVFYGGFPDSINKKYLGFETENFIDGEVFRRNFVETTKVPSSLPADLFSDSTLIHVKKAEFRKCFSTPKQSQIVLTIKGFEKFTKLYSIGSFCEFSYPYFVNDHTSLVYFNYQDGLDNVFSNVYLLIRKGQEWGIGARLRAWE